MFIRAHAARLAGSVVLPPIDPAFPNAIAGAAALLVLWLVLFWMHRRRIFVRI